MPGLPSCDVLDARRLHTLLPCSGGAHLWGTPGAQNSPGCRGLSQTGLWWVLSYNTRRSERSMMQRAVTIWFVVRLFFHHQEPRKVNDAERCHNLVCGESFLKQQALGTIQESEDCIKCVCGESFLKTTGVENGPWLRGLSQTGLRWVLFLKQNSPRFRELSQAAGSGESFLTTPGAHSPKCRRLSQTDLLWVLSYNTISSDQSKMVVCLSSQHLELRTVQDAEGCFKLVSCESFLQHQKLRTVQDTEGCPKLVCGGSFSYNTRSLEKSVMQRDVTIGLCWVFFKTSGTRNSPRCRGLP